MAEKMVRTQVYLPKDIYDKLKQRAAEGDTTMANQIREALAKYVTKPVQQEGAIFPKDDPIWDMIGMAESGVEDGSVNHDKYIYARDWNRDADNK